MKWKIGNLEIKNQVVLAPMAGISNPSYMKIIAEMGGGLAITELISSEAIVRNNKKTLGMLNGIDSVEMPVGVQIFGSVPETMAKAAQVITNLYNVSLIDINFGCPVPKVALRAEAGSGLLKHPDKVYSIVKSVVDAVSVPVTVKIRSGWDSQHINAVEIAKVAEKAGAQAVFVHPRTRSQGYSGKADWNIIRNVKDNVLIPVIGNGDIRCPEDAKRMLDETGCDAIMIGRGALGNPWIIENTIKYLSGTKLFDISSIEKIDMCLKHLKYLCDFKSEHVACLEIRNHISWYLKGIEGSNDIKKKIYQTSELCDIISILNNFKEELLNER